MDIFDNNKFSDKMRDNAWRRTKYGRRVKKGDYVYLYCPHHPRSENRGYILEHIVVAENHIGRMLRKGEIVHHKNGDGRDNRISNLKVVTRSEHWYIHATKSYPSKPLRQRQSHP